MKRYLLAKLFDLWMAQYHPYYYLTVAIVATVLALVFVCSIAFIWFFDWWWKMSLSTLAAWLVLFIVNHIATNAYFDQFMQRKQKIKL